MPDFHSIVRLHDQANASWHLNQALAPGFDHLTDLTLRHHRANFDLWHEEDEARDPEASDHTIAHVKHAIDGFNQQRNDLVEQIDSTLLVQAGPQPDSAPLNSETPGLILDRLSILSLKIFHTAEEADRSSASEVHRARNRERLAVLEQQRIDLVACLERLWAEILAGERRFKLYRQMKMYNDPELNPILYNRAK